MELTQLQTPLRGEMPISFFDESPAWGIPEQGLYKVYHDGSHYVGTLCNKRGDRKCIVSEASENPRKKRTGQTETDILFDMRCSEAVNNGLKGKALENTLCLEMRNDVDGDVREYVQKHIRRRWHNLYARKKRFRRKAYLNPWNYFVTITYDDNKLCETEFKQRLRKCLANFATRRNWRYMGVFERAPETGRLHFHALLFVPEYEMVGEIRERRDYSTQSHDMQTTYANTFFERTFGRNDFKELTDVDLTHGNTIEYLLKYIGKSNERIVYSRGIKGEVMLELPGDSIACEMQDYVQKYVLFDDIVDWSTDVMRFKYEQQTFLT